MQFNSDHGLYLQRFHSPLILAMYIRLQNIPMRIQTVRGFGELVTERIVLSFTASISIFVWSNFKLHNNCGQHIVALAAQCAITLLACTLAHNFLHVSNTPSLFRPMNRLKDLINTLCIDNILNRVEGSKAD